MKLAFVLVLLSVVTVSSAQSDGAVAIFLKNGDVQFGKVINTDTHGNIRLSNYCGIFTINASEIDSVSTHSMPASPAMINETLPADYSRIKSKTKDKGYYNLTSIALLFGEGRTDLGPVPSITMVNGWQINRRFFAGIGTGYEHYDWGVMPLFADAKYMLKLNGVLPYISLKLGYSFPVQDPSNDDDSYYGSGVSNYYGGIQVNPEAGIRVVLGNNTSIMISLGYHYQELSQKDNSSEWYYGYDRKTFTNFNRINLRLGFMFQ